MFAGQRWWHGRVVQSHGVQFSCSWSGVWYIGHVMWVVSSCPSPVPIVWHLLTSIAMHFRSGRSQIWLRHTTSRILKRSGMLAAWSTWRPIGPTIPMLPMVRLGPRMPMTCMRKGKISRRRIDIRAGISLLCLLRGSGSFSRGLFCSSSFQFFLLQMAIIGFSLLLIPQHFLAGLQPIPKIY